MSHSGLLLSQGWVKVEPNQAINGGNVHVYASGSNSVALCPDQQSTAASLDVHNSGSGSVVISNVNALQNTVELSGTGPISISASAASMSSGHVSLSGSSQITVRTRAQAHPLVLGGYARADQENETPSATECVCLCSFVQVGMEQASVDLRGMGDIYLAGAKSVRGSLSGIGHVHVPVDASCFLSSSGIGGCDQNNFPPSPPATCDSFGPDGIANANALHWTITVQGNKCSSSSCAMIRTTLFFVLSVVFRPRSIERFSRIDPCTSSPPRCRDQGRADVEG